ncbi:hypothetical protein ACQP2T_34750 [Nonomuraea sp. CA-143628]|uniref:hypothetical protein n=1 Tax=Nonomuraea sp. CA-143628 TaxID=3239997 RepID=UPI003D8B8FEE
MATWALPFILGLAVFDGSLTATGHDVVLAARTVGFLVAVPVGGVPAGPAGAPTPDLLTPIEQRTAGYWACHHQQKFPRPADYSGRRLITALQDVAASASR